MAVQPTSEIKNVFNYEHPDYRSQVDTWTKMEELYIGTEAVKAAGSKYLPTTEAEDEEIKSAGQGRNVRTAYDRRLENAVYFNGVDRLTKYAIGHMYKTNPIYAENAPDWFIKMQADCDLLGTTLDTFTRDISMKSYFMGHYFVMADFPNTEGMDSRAVQKIQEPRPYLVPVHPKEVINWSISRSLDGTFQFDWLIHRYYLSESDGPGQPHYMRVYYKVWFKDKWELHKVTMTSLNDNLDEIVPEKISEGTNSLGVVPFVPVYSQMVRPMVSKPPLLEAANLNIDHYRTFSNFMNGLLYHLSPILVTTGTQEAKIKRGANSALQLPRGATADYVETTGHGLKIALDTAILIATEMWEAGMRSDSAIGANTSSDARKLSRSDFFSFLLSVSNSHQHAYATVIKIAGEWADAPVTDLVPIKLNSDFDITTLDANQSEFLLNARKAGEISKKLFLQMLKRGEVFNRELNIPEELAEAAKDLKDDLAALAAAEAAAGGGTSSGAPGQGPNDPPPGSPTTPTSRTTADPTPAA